jgi:hypothetical protein
MCFLNVGGLKNKEGSKLEDLFFINKINKYDIVFLAETHIGYESTRILPYFLYSTVSFSMHSRISWLSPWVYDDVISSWKSDSLDDIIMVITTSSR